MKKTLLLSAGLMLSGCLLINQATGSLPAGSERLYSLMFSAATLDIRVESYGCTKADDFVVEVDNKAVTVLRKKADRCRAMPRIIELQLPLPELAKGDYSVTNAFVYQR